MNTQNGGSESPDDTRTVVGHEDLGPVAGPSQWKRFAAVGAFVAVLAGSVTYVSTRGGDDDAEQVLVRDAGEDDVSAAEGSDTPDGEAPLDGEDSLDDGEPLDGVGSDDPATGEAGSSGDVDSSADASPDSESAVSVPATADDPVAASLKQLCVDVRHQPVEGQDSSLSGVWVRGEVYGLEGGWIWVQGPSLNGGERVEIPIENGAFEGGLGIDRFGDHEIERFDFSDESGAVTDGLDQLDRTFGGVVPVTAAEGPAFESGCLDFPPPQSDTGTDSADDDASGSAEATGQGDETVESAPPGSTDDAPFAEEIEAFFDEFAARHVAGDSQSLIDTMYPPMREAFGPETCDEYIRSTTGSVASTNVVGVGGPRSLTITGPNAVVEIPAAVPVQVDFILRNGDVVPNDANVVIDDGEVYWLTQCAG